MSSLNLVGHAWIPVQAADGATRLIRPAEMVDDLSSTAIAWPRADFRIAQLEFLIGLLATCCAPADKEIWREWWDTPPDAATLDAAFAPFAHAFNLDGDGPRFLQDFTPLDSAVEGVERLLIEAPGEQGMKKNTDLLVKRGQAKRLACATAAIALYTLQSWAPAGGAGNRTGLRGGGPLLTLFLPERRTTLWHLLWANVPCGEVPATADMPRVFPWLAPTHGSQNGEVVTPANAHPAQVWWGMPRRIRLVFEAGDAPCGLTGTADPVVVAGWRQRPYGANYDAWGKVHPLTPHYRMKPGAEWLPVHPQPGGIGYRHWLGLVLESEDGMRIPAACVTTGRDRGLGRSRLLAAGFDMDNMKARGFVESEMPLPGAADPAERRRIDKLATALVRGAEAAAGITRGAVRAALFAPGATVKADAELLNLAREKLWEVTEAAFFAALNEPPPSSPGDVPNPEHRFWLAILRRAAIGIFDELAPLAADMSAHAERVSGARRGLLLAFAGHGAGGNALFKALNIPPPEKADKARKAA
jgi:CRISPR system Cascade subunit CasA